MSKKTRAIVAALILSTVGFTQAVHANPLTQFATCAERYAVMESHGGGRDAQHYATRSGWFADLVEAVRPSSVTDQTLHELRLDARVSVMALLYQQRYSFDATAAEAARRALSRNLRECDGLTLG